MPDQSTPPTPRVQQTAIPGLGGVRLDLLDPAWIVQAAQRETRPDDELDEPPSEAEECARDLQQRLRLDGPRRYTTDAKGRGGRYDYARPELAVLVACGQLARKRYHDAEPTGHEDTAGDELARAVWWVYSHTARGLTDNDQAVQREWSARSLDVGYLATLRTAELPFRWLHLAGGLRSAARRIVLFALMHAIANGWNGITISGTEAARLWGIAPATWWRAVAWLEERGLLVRLRRYVPGEVRPSDLDRNWYGPGPALLAQLDAIAADFGPEPTAAELDALAAVEREHKRARAIRGRELRGAPAPGQDAPSWALDVADQAHAEASARTLQAAYVERTRAVLAGEATIGEDVPTADDVAGLDVEQLAELERLAAELVELPPAAELVELVELVEDQGERGDDADREAPEPPPALPGAPAGDVGGPGRVPAPAALAAARVCSSPISLSDGDPQGLEFPKNEPARRRAQPVPAPDQDRPRRPLARPGARAATTATPPPVDPWSREDWQARTVHDAPLAAWADAKRPQSLAPPKAEPGGPPPPQGECTGRATPGRSILSNDPGTRESARRKLLDALDGKDASMLDRLQALVHELARDRSEED